MLKKILAILFVLTLCLSAVSVFATGETVTEIPGMKVIFEVKKSEEVTETVGTSPATSTKVFAYPIQQLESQVGGAVTATLIHNADQNLKVLMSMYKGDRLLSVDLQSIMANDTSTADLRCTAAVNAPENIDVKDTQIKLMVWDDNYIPVQESAVITGADKRITNISGKDVRIFHGMGEIYSMLNDVEELEVTLADPDNCSWEITSANKNFKKGEFEITVTSNIDNSTVKYIVNPSYFKGFDGEQTHFLSKDIWESETPGIGAWASSAASYTPSESKYALNKYAVGDMRWEASGINISGGNSVGVEKDAVTGNKYIWYNDASSKRLYLRGNDMYGGTSANGWPTLAGDKDYELNIRTMNTSDDLKQNSGIRFYTCTNSSGSEGSNAIPNVRISFDPKGAVAFHTDGGTVRSTYIYAHKDKWMNIKAMLFRNGVGATKGYVYATEDGGEYKRSVDAYSMIHFKNDSINNTIMALHFSTHVGSENSSSDIQPKGKIDYAVIRQIEE